MSMEFSDMNQVGSGGGLASGIALGSMLNKRDDGDRQQGWFWAVIVFIIFVVIALVFLAFMRRDDKHKDYPATDLTSALAPLIAAKSMDCGNGKNYEYDHDHLEIKSKLEHNEDRAEMRRVQEEQNRQTQSFMQLGFGLSGQINSHEKTDLENFAKLENQLGMQNMALTQLLQKANNEDIINGVLLKLCGAPCATRC